MRDEINITGFKGIKVDINYTEIIDKNAERCVDVLKDISPKGYRKSKKYADGWEVRKGRKKYNGYYAEVWNATNYQLTHLLENGHLITNKRGGVGWAEGIPHVQKALDQIKPQFIQDMSEVEIDVGFE